MLEDCPHVSMEQQLAMFFIQLGITFGIGWFQPIFVDHMAQPASILERLFMP